MSSAFVVSTLVGVTVAMGLGLAAATLARKGRAASRHVLLMASLGVSLLLPVFSAVMPPVQIAVPIASAVEPVGSAPADVGGLEMNVASTIAEPQAQPQASSRFSWPSMSAVALGLWLAVAFVVVAPVFAGLRQMRWLRRTALPWHRGQSIADDRARAVNIRRRVAVLLHEVVAGPVTCGVHHAVILLPLDAESWSRADLDRALVHELEHVRRHDWLTQCVARALCACYWFHPLVWITRRQIALEAERACDDAVLTMAEGGGDDGSHRVRGPAGRLGKASICRGASTAAGDGGPARSLDACASAARCQPAARPRRHAPADRRRGGVAGTGDHAVAASYGRRSVRWAADRGRRAEIRGRIDRPCQGNRSDAGRQNGRARRALRRHRADCTSNAPRCLAPTA